MPIIQSAKKALRQNIRRHTQNTKQKESYKKAVKQYKRLISEKKLDDAKKLLPAVFKVLDKAAKTGVIKKNKASRLKSRLTKLTRAEH